MVMVVSFGIRMSEPESNQNQSETTESKTAESEIVESERKSDDPDWETTESKRETGPLNRINRRNLLKGVTAAALLGTTGATGTTGASTRENSLQAELASLGTYSEEGRAKQAEFRYQYAVKFVCGNAQGRALAVGRYNTAINIHNPNEELAEFRWKVAPAFVEEPGPFSDFIQRELEPDQALEVDCPHIFDVGADLRQQDLFKGFVVIQTNVQLDVVAVYSAGRETVETLDVERVEPRKIQRESDNDTPTPPDGDDLPDLVPESVNRIENRLLVNVLNRGASRAGPSVTAVEFGGFRPQTRETESLGPGESTVHQFEIPTGCLVRKCELTVIVDAEEDVEESNEENNTRSGTIPS